jgi:hypothetical protein
MDDRYWLNLKHLNVSGYAALVDRVCSDGLYQEIRE